MNWEERYVKEAFKIKFWERGDNWNKLLKESPYQNLSEPAPSFKVLGPSYRCELCGQHKEPEDLFKDKNSYYYCRSHYSIPKANTFSVQNSRGEVVSEGKDTKKIQEQARQETRQQRLDAMPKKVKGVGMKAANEDFEQRWLEENYNR